MVDVAIIGAGYWGSAISLKLTEEGITNRVVDDEDLESGSRNASAVCDPSAYDSTVFERYWPSNFDRSKLDESIEWLTRIGGYWVMEQFWNPYQNRPIRPRHKVIYLPDPGHLSTKVGARYRGRVVGIDAGNRGVEVFLDNGRVIVAYMLVVAAGYRTDDVLGLGGFPPLGVKSLLGRGITARGTPKVETPVSVMIKPYVKHTVRQWPGGIWKVGDTAEKSLNNNKLENLRSVGKTVLEGYEEIEVNLGYRPVLPQFTVDKIHPHVIVATGGHRLGLGLSYLVSNLVREMIR